MDRREAVMGTGLLALASFAGAAKAAGEESPHVHHGAHHKALADAAGAFFLYVTFDLTYKSLSYTLFAISMNNHMQLKKRR